MKTSDALLFTSERETLGLPLLEALYFEKPAVLPNKAYAREIYGDAGVYYDEDTPESVCRAILFLIDHYAIHAALAKERKFTDQKTEYSWSRHWDLFLAHRLGT